MHNVSHEQSPSPRDLWIGGEAVAGAGAPIDVHNPADRSVLGQVANGNPEQAIAAVAAAHAAGADWRSHPPRERAEVLRRCFDSMINHQEELAALVVAENGKALADARSEITYAAEFFRWYSEECVRVVGQLSPAPSGSNRILVEYQPIGVAVLVTPWNFPAAMATRKIAPALGAGCGVVLKPATETPLTAYAIAELCHEAGVPRGLLNVVTTRSAGPVVEAMLADPRVRALSFTGSTEVGKGLLRVAGDHVLKCSMELGGNAAFIVLEDANVEEAVEGLMVAKMRNGGQACTAANRIYAHASVIDELARALAERMAALRVGPGSDEGVDVGPLITQSAVDSVQQLVDEAVADGAKVLVGGTPSEGAGSFYPPTVLSGVRPTSRIVSTEIFGPVATFISFTDDEEAIEAANSTEYGLSSYVYSGDLARGLRVAECLESGMVAVNRGLVSDPAAPFGGVKHSGLGREGSREGILEFMEAKYIATAW